MRFKALFVAVIVAITAFVFATPASAAGERYITFSFGRAQFSQAVNCQTAPGAVTLLQVASYMQTKGLVGTANLVPKYLDNGIGKPNNRWCQGGKYNYISYGDATWLQNNFGWTHASSGLTYTPLVGLTADQQRREVCGSYTALANKGFKRFNGVFAAPAPADQDSLNDTIVKDIVKPCGFYLGRDYGKNTWNYMYQRPDGSRIPFDIKSNMTPAGYSRTFSVNGGSCTAYTTCSTGGTREYMDPWQFVQDMRDAPLDSHATLQGYKFVKGDVPGSHKCTGTVHSTSEAEMYCWEDYKIILDNIPSDYVNTDALTVVEKWGIIR